MAWQLATKYFQPLLVSGDKRGRKVYFPIFHEPSERGKKTKIFTDDSVDQNAIDEIAAVQLYNAGFEPPRDLAYLVNIDKH